MCLKCVLKTLNEGSTEAPAEKLEREFELAELHHMQAEINASTADSILKLAQAIKWLGDGNFTREAKLVIGVLERIVGKQVDAPAAKSAVAETNSAEQVNRAAAMANQPLSTEIPSELQELIRKLRAEGFEVEVMPIPL